MNLILCSLKKKLEIQNEFFQAYNNKKHGLNFLQGKKLKKNACNVFASYKKLRKHSFIILASLKNSKT
eukprot:UN21603